MPVMPKRRDLDGQGVSPHAIRNQYNKLVEDRASTEGTGHDPDERVAIPLDIDEALRGLLAVDPDDEPAEDDDAKPDQRN